MLNQTNLQFNNNKFYLIQLLEDDNARNYSVWMRWGRGKYDLLHLDYKAKDAVRLSGGKEQRGKRSLRKQKDILLHSCQNNPEADPKKTVSKPKVVSQLDLRVQSLVELICSIRTMEEMVIEMKYDTQKTPLGKLTAEQIQAGYRSLQKIEACLKWSQTGSVLLEACNEFYTRIPHDFGLKTPPIIKTLKEVQEKAQLLEALSEIHIGIKHMQSEQSDLEHPLDQSYRSLDCELQPLEKASDVFQFGKGIYFADMSSKSANYCFATREKDVALGECNELLEANPEAEKLLISKHSTKGLGKLAPAGCFSLHGATVPVGPAKETGIANTHGYTLNYNEFVVYDPRQVRMKYLLKVRFNFTQLCCLLSDENDAVKEN
ncbi:Poly [ADP-ribose] polymerase 2, partial [Ophiophagus hannah]